jgi:integrase
MRPFESDGQLQALAAELGPRYGPMVLFAAATGLRPGEWIALEHRDIDLNDRLVTSASLPRQPPQAHQDQHRTRRAAPAIRPRRAGSATHAAFSGLNSPETLERTLNRSKGMT